MKISETKRSHIDEGPLDLLTKSGRARRRSFKQGKKTVKLTVQNLQNEFAEYLGVLGKRNFNQATVQDVIDFLDNKNVDTSDINPSEPMSRSRLKNIFTVQSRAAIQGKGTKKPPTPAPASTGSAGGSGSSSSGGGAGGGSSGAGAGAGAAPTAYAQVRSAALKLKAKDKRRLIKQIQKTLPATGGSGGGAGPTP